MRSTWRHRVGSPSIPLVSLVLSLALLFACSRSNKPLDLVVFAAAGGKPAIEEICQRFEDHHGLRVGTTYGGGGEILSRMILARSGDVYVAPEQGFMESAQEEQAIDPETIRTVAYMVPVIAVKKGNPKRIRSLADLANHDVRLAMTRPETTLLGKYAPEIFRKAGLEEPILRNVVTHASDPNNLVTMLILDQVDAGIIWHFYGAMSPDKIETIFLSPQQITGIGEMQMAVSAYSKERALAQAFVDFSASSEGKAVFRKCGYIVEVEDLRRYWSGPSDQAIDKGQGNNH